MFLSGNPDVDLYLLFNMLPYKHLSILNSANKRMKRNIPRIGVKFGEVNEYALKKLCIDIPKCNYDYVCRKACKMGSKSTLLFVLNMGHVLRDKYLIKACKYGDLEFVKWLHGMIEGVISDACYYECFYRACTNGHLMIAKWLYNVKTQKLDIDMSVYWETCVQGHIDVIKWLLSLPHEIAKKSVNGCFMEAIRNGKLDIAEWVFATEELNINLRVKKQIFRSACENGHKQTAEFVLNNLIRNYDRGYILPKGFNGACSHGKLDIAIWLKSLNNLVEIECDVFGEVCEGGHIEMAKWLITTGKVILDENFGEYFRIACEYGHSQLADYLHTLHPECEYVIEYKPHLVPKIMKKRFTS